MFDLVDADDKPTRQTAARKVLALWTQREEVARILRMMESDDL